MREVVEMHMQRNTTNIYKHVYIRKKEKSYRQKHTGLADKSPPPQTGRAKLQSATHRIQC